MPYFDAIVCILNVTVPTIVATVLLTVFGLYVYSSIPYPGQKKKSGEEKGFMEGSSSSDSDL